MSTTYFLLFVLFINFVVFINFKKISEKLNVFDKPNYRKIHTNPISSIGGLIFFYNFVLFFLFDLIDQNSEIFNFFLTLRSKIIFIIIGFAIFVVGLKDDLKEANPYTKIFAFLLLLYIYFTSDKTTISLLRFETFSHIISLGDLGLIFTVLCVAAFMNSFNMFDGVNNQSSIFILNFLIYLFLISQDLLFFLSIFIPLAIFGIKNFNNKVFLGNNGSYFISFLLSVYIIKFYNFYPEKINVELVLCILSVPILDMIRLFIVRFKLNQSPFSADRQHIHHLLLKKYGLIKTNFLISINLFFPTIIFYFLNNSLYSLILSIIIYLILFFIVSNKDMRK